MALAISARTWAMASGTSASSSFISRRISIVGKELICAVRGFSCSVGGMESETLVIVDEAILSMWLAVVMLHTATGQPRRFSWAIRPAAIVGEKLGAATKAFF